MTFMPSLPMSNICRKPLLWLMILILGGGILAPGLGLAQSDDSSTSEEKAPAVEELSAPEDPKKDSEKDSGKDSGKDLAKDSERPSDWERLIYIPYKNLKQVFESQGNSVLVPLTEFMKLQARPTTGASKPPIAALLSEAKYTGTIEKDVARLQAELTVQSLVDSWAELPVKFGDVAIGKIAPGHDDVFLRGTGNGSYSLLLPKKGIYKIRLELMARVRTSPEGKSLEFECPPAGVCTFDLSIPEADQTIQITPQLVTTPVEGAGEKTTRVRANLGATNKISARWHPRVSASPEMELLATVQNTLEVRIADGLIHTHAALAYQVLRGQLDQVRVVIPKDHRILDVTAPGLKSWKAESEDKRQIVTIDLLGGAGKSLTVDVHTERQVPEDQFDVGGLMDEAQPFGIHALGPVHESGLLLLTAATDLVLTVEQAQGLVRIETAEVPQAYRRQGGVAYKFYTPKFRMQVNVKPVEPRILVQQETRFVLSERELRSTARLNYTVERTGVFELRLQAPAGLMIDRVDCEPMKGFAHDSDSGLLTISLRQKTIGAVNVVVTGHLSRDPMDQEEMILPVLEPQGTQRETGQVILFAPESLEILASEQELEGARPAELVTIPGIPAGSRLAASWNYDQRPLKIAVVIARKPSRLTAAVQTAIHVKPELVTAHSDLKFVVQYSPLDTFRFAVPESAAATVRVESINPTDQPIRQSTHEEPADGWVTYTVVMQRPFTGEVPLRVSYDHPLAGKEQLRQLKLQPPRVLAAPPQADQEDEIPLTSVSGSVTVGNDQGVAVTATATEMQAADIREIAGTATGDSLAFRYFRQAAPPEAGPQLELSVTRYEIQKVVETVIMRSLAEAVIGEDKDVLLRYRALLKTSERQRLALELPKGAEVFDLLVAGRKVELEKNPAGNAAAGRQSFYINVSRETSSDSPFVMTIVFRAPFLDRPLRGYSGRLALPLPRIGRAGERELEPAPTQELQAAIWIPDGYVISQPPEQFASQNSIRVRLWKGVQPQTTATADVQKWFGEPTGGVFEFRTAGHAYRFSRLGAVDSIEVTYWWMPLFTWVISGTLLLIGAILLQTPWENRLGVLLLLAVAAAFYALVQPDLVLHVLAAARFGVLAMIALWIIHSLTRPRKRVVVYHPGDPASAVSAFAAVIPPPTKDV